MAKPAQLPRRPRILLSGVFGPYGLDDEFGRKENLMELFHNQVTKAQRTASFRFFHRSFGLYFLAENVDADVTVLDFPSRRRFEKEVSRGYDIVGISFITPNFTKAKVMAEAVRWLSPGSEILLGGHGAAIEGVEDLIECDHVVRGEGIAWLRRHLGQDPDAPIKHPTLPSTESQTIMGVPVPGPTASLLVPGVGCVNGCSFCCTSHFFGKKYTSFLGDGRTLFETAKRIADARGTDTFFIMDENFLKDRARAMSLLDEMERRGRYFRFHIFSSAEAITAFGLDNLVRLGVQMIWIGFESKSRRDIFEKNNGIDGPALVKELRDRGIAVLASGILCMEHHTPENIDEDIRYLIDLEADMVQYMLFTPLPVTALYRDHKRRGLLREDIPFEEWHGQKMLNYRHPAFEEGQPEEILNRAFDSEYQANSSSLYRVIETAFRGYERLSKIEDPDPCLKARVDQLKEIVVEYAVMLPELAAKGVNELERERARTLDDAITSTIGPPTLKSKIQRAAARLFAARWRLRVKLFGDGIQPKTMITRYRPGRRAAVDIFNDAAELASGLKEDLEPPRAAAITAGD